MSSAPDFIEVYPGALPKAVCASAIEWFEKSGAAQRGKTGGGVDVTLKDSWDIEISGKPEWKPLVDAIQNAAFAGFREYVRKYKYTLLAPLSLKLKHPETGELTAIDAQSIDKMPDETFGALLQYGFRPGSINLQKYIADQGGYPYWHCEHYPKQATVEPLHRVLLYSIYLNDAFSAGETEFLYQSRKIAPKTGDLLIAPAFFTHTHRGNKPVGGDKYIATSWILYQRAEALWPAG